MNATRSGALPSHEEVVAGFNLLGYDATFAAVAQELNGVSAADLYDLYASREVLAEVWLCGAIPPSDAPLSVRSLFTSFVYGLLEPLQRQRDFGRAWIQAMPRSAALQLPALASVHARAREYFATGLQALHDQIGMPALLPLDQALDELSEALTLAAVALVVGWGWDRSEQAGATGLAVESTGTLIDALLTRRADFGDTSLLVHLHRLLSQPHNQFTRPLLDIVAPPGRAARFTDGEGLVAALRNLLPPQAAGPR